MKPRLIAPAVLTDPRLISPRDSPSETGLTSLSQLGSAEHPDPALLPAQHHDGMPDFGGELVRTRDWTEITERQVRAYAKNNRGT
ncbi:MAG: hypothetical protein ACRC20_04810 [Segniliparus sp.]|uniref:hypothetical protein n=1 Tax=Segniliparus sp. TaxID=2804064 RepID=UPI003F3B132D